MCVCPLWLLYPPRCLQEKKKVLSVVPISQKVLLRSRWQVAWYRYASLWSISHNHLALHGLCLCGCVSVWRGLTCNVRRTILLCVLNYNIIIINLDTKYCRTNINISTTPVNHTMFSWLCLQWIDCHLSQTLKHDIVPVLLICATPKKLLEFLRNLLWFQIAGSLI